MSRAFQFMAMAMALALAASGLRSLPAAEDVTKEEAKEGTGRIWEILSAPFRRRPVPDIPGHRKVGAKVAQRRTRLSPFVVPVQGAETQPVGAGAGKGTLLSTTAGRQVLEETEVALARAGEALDTQSLDALAKELDGLDRRLADAVFSDRDQRLKAQVLSERLRALKHRVEIRTAFAKRSLRVSFIICAPEGKSLAVVNQRILREGEELVPGLAVARIEPREVVFRVESEEVAVGLQ